MGTYLCDEAGKPITKANPLYTALEALSNANGTSLIVLSGEPDSNGRLVLRVVDAAPWGYDTPNGDLKNAITRSVPAQVTTHNAVSVAAGALGTEVAVSMKGYKQAIVFVKSDQQYDLQYRISDGVNPSYSYVLASGQTATGAQARSHVMMAGSGYVWLFADTLYIQPKNVGTGTATMTVSVYMLP